MKLPDRNPLKMLLALIVCINALIFLNPATRAEGGPVISSATGAAAVIPTAVASPTAVPTPYKSASNALILYDGPANEGDGCNAAREVANLLPHFGFTADILPIASYSSGMADKFDTVFVCGMGAGTIIPPAVLTDLAQRDRTVCWIDQFIGQLTDMPNMAERLGFVHDSYDDDTGYTTVTYHDVDLPKTDPELNRVHILDPSKVQVLATAGSGDDTAPYVLRSGNFWFFAGPIFSFTYPSDQGLVFMDLLHDMLGVKPIGEHRALVRLEDVSANSDPENLRRIADVLIAHKVPFQIALIPVFVDPNNHVEFTLADRPEVVDVLHYMTAHGGSIVMHGITHQKHGVSGADFEFWDTLSDRATADGALTALRPKLQRGFEECFRVGLFPLVFETPHYAASFNHYRAFATVFSHCYERRMVCDDMYPEEYFPFITKDICGQTIIPENLGYVHVEDPDTEPIISAAERLMVVRDSIASFYFHPFMPPRALDKILTAIQSDGYRFASIKEFSPYAAFGDYAVSAKRRQFTLTPAQSFLKTVTVDAQGQSTEQFKAVKAGKPLSIEVDPPPGGFVALQSVTHPPLAKRELTWFEKLKIQIRGPEPDLVVPSTVHARKAVIAGKSAAFESVLGAYGIPFKPLGSLSQLTDDTVVVVPHDSALDEAQQKRLAAWVNGGGRIVLEGRSPLAERLGFSFDGNTFSAKNLQDLALPDVPVNCSRYFKVDNFTPPTANVTLVQDTTSQQPIAVVSRIGEGAAIYLGAWLDPDTGLGYTRYPFLMLHLRQRFGLQSRVASDGVEFYFDPGYREKASLEELVASWKTEGVRAIYVGAWHFWPKWSYDYDHLIRLCHNEGIAVYAWLELPEVSPKFWAEHPEWREKTATGKDAEIGWRQFMNLADEKCRASVMNWVDDLLSKHDWDGVNIAELSFDTKAGLEDPASYIPMNAQVRAKFQEKAGFDPALLFDEQSAYHWKNNPGAASQWSQFRTELTRDWLSECLDHLSKHRIDIIVTALDSIVRPGIIDKTGCDSRDVVALMDRHPFTLQVEDPEEMWGDPPDRYSHLGEIYRKLVRDPSRLMFDINVVNDRPAGIAPTALASGIELALTVRAAAAAGNGRVGIYSESTVLDEDRALLPFVMGSRAKVTAMPGGAVVNADRPVRYQFDTWREENPWWDLFKRSTAFTPWPVPVVDGQSWPYGSKGCMLLSSGEHRFTGIAPHAQSELPWVNDITAPFSAVVRQRQGFSFDYSSARRCWLTMMREPSRVLNDGQPLPPSTIQPHKTDWVVELPAGTHRVGVEEATTASVVVRDAGEKASQSIVWLGLRGIFFLTAVYGAVRVRRLWLTLRGKGNS